MRHPARANTGKRPTSTEGIYLIASKQQAAALKSHDDFNRPEARIAVYLATVQERLTKQYFPKATLVQMDPDETEMAAVLDGRAHAVLMPTFAPRAIVETAPEKLWLPFDAPLQTTVSAMAVRKGDPDFLNFLDSWLSFQRDNGWLGERIGYWSQATDWTK